MSLINLSAKESRVSFDKELRKPEYKDVCDSIRLYFDAAINTWCNNCETKSKWFSASDFIGKDLKNWDTLPVKELWNFYKYKKHLSDKEAYKRAGIAAGWLLKDAVIKNKRFTFETKRNILHRVYRCV